MNSCKCGCGTPVAKNYAQGHGVKRPLLIRFMEKVVKSPDGCWMWTGAVSTNGYGRIGIDSYHLGQAHRVAYELLVGAIPDGLHIDHLCRNRLCVNPEHLEPVTQAENNRRAWAANLRTHCRRGHEFTPDNVLRSSSGARNCRTCRRMKQRELRRSRRALLTGERP